MSKEFDGACNDCRGELRRDRVRRPGHGCQTDTDPTGPAAAEVLAAFRSVRLSGRDFGQYTGLIGPETSPLLNVNVAPARQSAGAGPDRASSTSNRSFPVGAAAQGRDRGEVDRATKRVWAASTGDGAGPPKQSVQHQVGQIAANDDYNNNRSPIRHRCFLFAASVRS